MKNVLAGVKRILVVEDEPSIGEVCLRTLTKSGLKVDIAVNGRVALDKMGRQDYDLILIDIKAPVMNGKELYHHMLERYPYLETRVIFTSGDVMGDDTQGFLKLTGRPFLPKPFTPDELEDIVRETLKQIGK